MPNKSAPPDSDPARRAGPKRERPGSWWEPGLSAGPVDRERRASRRNSPLGLSFLGEDRAAGQAFFPRFFRSGQCAEKTMRRHGKGRMGTKNGAADRDAADGGAAQRRAQRRLVQRKGPDRQETRTAIEAGQVEARRDIEPRDQQAAGQRVEHGPAAGILQRREAVPESAPEEALPEMVRAPAEDDPGLLPGEMPAMGGTRAGGRHRHARQPGNSRISAPSTLTRGAPATMRSEERRVGKECGYQCRSRWSPYH